MAPTVSEHPKPSEPLRRGHTRPTSSGAGGLPAWLLPASAAALLMLAIHGALVLSAARDQVAGPFPHFDGNCSVSKACRQVPAVHVFRALTLPSATLLVSIWWVAAQWLRARGLAGPRLRAWILGLGVAGAVFLVLYATFLGTEGHVYRMLRRYGIYVFFGGTGIAQLLLAWALTRADPALLPELERWVLRALQAIVLFMLVAGPLNIVADTLVEHDRIANILEWWYGVSLAAFAALLARVWERGKLALLLELGVHAIHVAESKIPDPVAHATDAGRVDTSALDPPA